MTKPSSEVESLRKTWYYSVMLVMKQPVGESYSHHPLKKTFPTFLPMVHWTHMSLYTKLHFDGFSKILCW